MLAVVWGLEKFQFYFYGKKVHFYTDHQVLEPLIKRHQSNQQCSARWLYRLAHFDIAVQHIADSNMKTTDFFSRNPVGCAAIEDEYDEQYVINILTEHAELNVKYGSLFDRQSETEKKRKRNWNETEREKNQSQANRTTPEQKPREQIQHKQNYYIRAV